MSPWDLNLKDFIIVEIIVIIINIIFILVSIIIIIVIIVITIIINTLLLLLQLLLSLLLQLLLLFLLLTVSFICLSLIVFQTCAALQINNNFFQGFFLSISEHIFHQNMNFNQTLLLFLHFISIYIVNIPS